MKRITYKDEYGEPHLINCGINCENYKKCIAIDGDRSNYSCNRYLINIIAKYEDLIDSGTFIENTNKNKNVTYLIKNIEEYGKLIAYCIQNDIDVSKTYWEEGALNKHCYHIDVEKNKCLYNTYEYYKSKGYKIVEPEFYIDAGNNISIL